MQFIHVRCLHEMLSDWFLDWIKSLILSTDDQYIISGSADLSMGAYNIQNKEISGFYPDIHTGISTH